MAALPALQIESLRYRYPGSREAVVDVASLRLDAGEQALLTGGSGSGKSTLLHLIAGLTEPTTGTVRVAGTDIHAVTGAARDKFRGQRIGLIFQTHQLLMGFSALENVELALAFTSVPPREHTDKAKALLERLGIERIHAAPEDLSVGQQQRVAVARALVVEPALVLADEPTASLDPENAVTAVDLIQEVCREKKAALLMVSHDPSLKDRFETVHVLDRLAGVNA
ncbi:MAG: ABC transporter ATP-binding protein [Planctomycetota bacterium]